MPPTATQLLTDSLLTDSLLTESTESTESTELAESAESAESAENLLPACLLSEHLLRTGQIWQASRKSPIRPALSTGYAALDRQLHCAGWPQGAVSELLLSHTGIGEIRLLSPLLARLNQQAGYITWINPPYQPYAPALVAQRLQLSKMLVIRTSDVQQSIWAARQAMVSRACSVVLLWLPQQSLCKEIRQLNLAAKAGNCWGIILRPERFQQQPSAAVLRIVMQLEQRRQQLSIIKQPGGWNGQQVSLDLFPERVHWNPLAASHWPVFSPNARHPQRREVKLRRREHVAGHQVITALPSYH